MGRSACTDSPTTEWVAEHAKQFLDCVQDAGLPIAVVTRDNDRLYRQFDETLAARGVQAKRLAIRAPNTNAYVERFIQSLQVECLDHFLAFGEKHLDYLVREYVEHYHTERPHQGLGNRTIAAAGQGEGEPVCAPHGDVCRRTRLGGVLSHYVRGAA